MSAPRLQIASRANPRVKQLRAAFAGQPRLSGGLVAIEGENLLFEAIRAGLTLHTVFLIQSRNAPSWLPPSVELIELTHDIFASAVDTKSPQGIAALLAPPAWQLEDAFAAANPLLVVAANLQDPGNLGTILRSAQAFGAHAVLTTPGTVSEWNQKALRASAGSVFSLPVLQLTHTQIVALKTPANPGAPALASETWANRRRIHLFAAVASDPASSQSIPLSAADLTQPCALMIGNEGAGLSNELLALADTRVTIPTTRVESLNAAIAASVLLYEASRQRRALVRIP